MLFRVGDGERWRRGETLRISRDGLSFAARDKLSIGTRIDMRFFVGRKPVISEVACQGRVVRRAHSDPKSSTYAATIDCYRLNPMALSGLSG